MKELYEPCLTCTNGGKVNGEAHLCEGVITIFEGIFPPHVTPFDERREVDEQALRELVNFWIESGVHGLVTCASNGEGPYLSREERKKVIKVVLEEVGGRKPVIVGVSSPGTRGVVEQAKEAQELGADGILLTPPFYYKPSDAELLEHYRYVLKGLDIPVILYNVPKFVGYNVSIDVIRKVVEEFDNVVGIKDSSGLIWRISELIRLVGDKISVLAGTGDLILSTLLLGGKGAIVGVAIFAPEMAVDLYNAYKSGNMERARELQLKLTLLNEVVIKKFNQLSATKEALKLRGKPGGLPRLPALPLSEGGRETIRQVLREVGLL